METVGVWKRVEVRVDLARKKERQESRRAKNVVNASGTAVTDERVRRRSGVWQVGGEQGEVATGAPHREEVTMRR
eukprot:1557022-Prorocentrum_lima.AAC.1